MSQASQAKSAKARATIALRLMRTVKDLGNCRAFDDCGEMGDGDEMVAHIIIRAHHDPSIATLVKSRGFGYWLERGYLDRMTTEEDYTTTILLAITLQGREEAQPQAQEQIDPLNTMLEQYAADKALPDARDAQRILWIREEAETAMDALIHGDIDQVTESLLAIHSHTYALRGDSPEEL